MAETKTAEQSIHCKIRVPSETLILAGILTGILMLVGILTRILKLVGILTGIPTLAATLTRTRIPVGTLTSEEIESQGGTDSTERQAQIELKLLVAEDR